MQSRTAYATQSRNSLWGDHASREFCTVQYRGHAVLLRGQRSTFYPSEAFVIPMACDLLMPPLGRDVGTMTQLVVLLIIAAIGVGSPSSAWSWGCRGHETIALIARAQLTANARQQVDDILSRANRGHQACAPIDEPMASFSTWADDNRDFHRDWHFLDIPRGSRREDMNQACPDDGCVTLGLRGEMATLKDPSATAKEREIALLFILHLVGDIHQPLHCTTNGDRGGNCVPVAYLVDGHNRQPHPRNNGASYDPNLHHIWDVDLLERAMPTDSNGAPDAAAYAKDLTNRFKTDIAAWQKEDLNVENWAWETHELAEQTAYGGLPTKIPDEPADGQLADCTENNNVGDRMTNFDEEIDDRYADTAHPVIERQLAKAGTRLAMVLNSVWP